MFLLNAAHGVIKIHLKPGLPEFFAQNAKNISMAMAPKHQK
jgi:hypothetical protein